MGQLKWRGLLSIAPIVPPFRHQLLRVRNWQLDGLLTVWMMMLPKDFGGCWCNNNPLRDLHKAV